MLTTVLLTIVICVGKATNGVMKQSTDRDRVPLGKIGESGFSDFVSLCKSQHPP